MDVTGDEKNLGKPVGSDAKNNKSTYVSLTSIDAAKNLAQKAVDEAVDALKNFGAEADFLRDLVKYLIGRNK